MTLSQRVLRSAAGRLRGLRASPLLHPGALSEWWRERGGGHAVANHLPHLTAAIEWIERAQDATPDDGVARGYGLTWHPYFRARGWQPSYPETTGYIIPTLFEAARALGRPELARRAERAARWEVAIQLSDGAVRGGVMGEPESPAVFNTGQVMFGWLAAWGETGDAQFAEATRRAASWLLAHQSEDGHWRKSSRFARDGVSLYNARTAWALAEAGVRLNQRPFLQAAARQLHATAELQLENGWLPDCCLSDPQRPLLHTVAYAVRGLLEGGRLLGDATLVAAAARIAGALARTVRADGWMPGRYAADWRGTVSWSCLTGQAQMVNNWIRLFDLTADRAWLDPVPGVLRFLKRTQSRDSTDPGVRGGIKGSHPLTGEYNRWQMLNWATKYFADALLRHTRVTGPVPQPSSDTHILA